MSPLRSRARRLVAWAVLLCAAAPPGAYAHPAPEHVIEDLTRRIADGAPAADLLVRRGDEQRAMRRDHLAAVDYAAALRIDPRHSGAWLGMARVRLAEGRTSEARAAAAQGLASLSVADGPGPDDVAQADRQAPFYATIAQAHEADGAYGSAAQAWRCAVRAARPEIDWQLGLAGVLSRCGQPEAARDTLAAAMQHNPSVVLERAWVEALIECGDLPEALQRVEAGLARSRWRGSWLLLRAQIADRAGRHVEARRDAQGVIDEIDQRTHPARRNPLLEADRDAAQRLLDDRPEPL